MRMSHVFNFGPEIASKELAGRFAKTVADVYYKVADTEEKKARAIASAVNALGGVQIQVDPEFKQMLIIALRKRMPHVREFKELR